jgi:trimeric autotransporter adhesin
MFRANQHGGSGGYFIFTGGNVGIGTTSPNNAKLVISDTGSNKISIDGGTSQNGMRWEAVGGANTFYLYNGTSGTAGFGLYNVNTAATPLWIQNGGNVGIGTTSPATKLEISSTAADADRTIPHNVLTITAEQGNAPYGFFGGSILFKNRSYTTGMVESARIRSVIYDDGAPNNFGGGIWLETTPTPGGTLTPSFVLNYLGNVGIGTTAPAKKLSVQTIDTATYDPAVNAAEVSVTRANTSNTTGQVAGISLNATGWSGGTTGVVVLNAIQQQGNYSNADFAIQNRVGGSFVETFRITAYGDVGIANSSPGSLLHIGTYASAGKYVDSSTLPTTPANHLITLAPPSTAGYYGGGIAWSEGTDVAASINAYDAGSGGALGLVFSTGNNTTLSERLRIDTSGSIQLNDYGLGAFTGTVAYNLAVDASGNIIETAGGVVDGSGTANYVTKWQDANTVTNSSITDDGTTVTATAANFVSQSNLGTAYTSFTTSGTTAIFDTITRTNSAIYQIVIVANPNSAGSSAYADFYYGKVFIGTGYNGSAVVDVINYHQESPLPRGLYGSGGGDLTVTAVMLVGGSEVTEVAINISYTIRIKIAGYVVAGANTTVRLQRIM